MSSGNSAAQTPATHYPMGRIVGQFLLVVLAYTAAVYVLTWAVDHFTGVTVDGTPMGLIVPMVAALTVAATWYEREQARPAKGRIWKATLICGLANMAFQCAIFALLIWADLLQDALGPASELLAGDGLKILLWVLLGAGLVQMLFIRVGFWLGFSGAVKRAQAKAARG